MNKTFYAKKIGASRDYIQDIQAHVSFNDFITLVLILLKICLQHIILATKGNSEGKLDNM